ncbi:MAG: hypothetical protein ACE5JH_01375 [Acidobacteriota bacterium]
MERAGGRLRDPAGRAAVAALVVGLAWAAGGHAAAQALPQDDRREDRERWPAGGRGRAIGMWERFEDSNDRQFDQFSGFLAYKQSHAQVWSGDYFDGFEIGGYLRDSRRSTYAALYRFRDEFDHILQFDVEQVAPRGFVVAGSLRLIDIIHHDEKQREAAVTGEAVGDDFQAQFGAGFDWYWGDYNFLSFRAISDPREGGRWSFVTTHRFSRTETIYVQPAVILRTDGSASWFVRGQYRHVLVVVGKFDEFDFTDVDRTIYSAAFEIRF